MNIAVGCDAAGLKLKNEIHRYLEGEHTVIDFGCHTTEPADYPKYAGLVAEAIQSGETDRGILVCGTGVGVSIAANRYRGVRAVVGQTALGAVMSREHNDSNCLCFGQWIPPIDTVWQIIDAWLFGKFSNGEAHLRRIKMMDGGT